nr:MAG TPA: hypothetical protein [Caudoviricetes sp.]
MTTDQSNHSLHRKRCAGGSLTPPDTLIITQ